MQTKNNNSRRGGGWPADPEISGGGPRNMKIYVVALSGLLFLISVLHKGSRNNLFARFVNE